MSASLSLNDACACARVSDAMRNMRQLETTNDARLDLSVALRLTGRQSVFSALVKKRALVIVAPPGGSR